MICGYACLCVCFACRLPDMEFGYWAQDGAPNHQEMVRVKDKFGKPGEGGTWALHGVSV